RRATRLRHAPTRLSYNSLRSERSAAPKSCGRLADGPANLDPHRIIYKYSALTREETSQVVLLLTFLDRSHVCQVLYLSNEICEQRRGIVPPPRERQRQRHIQVGDGQDDHTFRTPPTGCAVHPPHAYAVRHKA